MNYAIINFSKSKNLIRFLFILILTSLMSKMVFAHCPYEFQNEDQSYCLDVLWLNADSRQGPQFVESEFLSPYLNSMQTPSRDRLFSKAEISIWTKGDSSHTPVEIEGLEIYPYMVMKDGHHHGTKSVFEYNSIFQVYTLSQINFQDMPGCWSLRLKTLSNEEQIILNLNFNNPSMECKI